MTAPETQVVRVVGDPLNDPQDPSTPATWTSLLTALVLLGVGIASLFGLNINKDALLGLVPSAALLAAALVAAVHTHSAHNLAIARLNVRAGIYSQNMAYGREDAAGLPANWREHLDHLKNDIVATLHEDWSRITRLEPAVLSHGESLAGQGLGDVISVLERIENHLTTQTTPLPASVPFPTATDGGPAPSDGVPSSSGDQVTTDPLPGHGTSAPESTAPTTATVPPPAFTPTGPVIDVPTVAVGD